MIVVFIGLFKVPNFALRQFIFDWTVVTFIQIFLVAILFGFTFLNTIPSVVVNIDFRDENAIKVSELTKHFPEMQKSGAQALLIQWDDSYPGSQVHNHSMYSKEDIQKISSHAKNYNLQIINYMEVFYVKNEHDF